MGLPLPVSDIAESGSGPKTRMAATQNPMVATIITGTQMENAAATPFSPRRATTATSPLMARLALQTGATGQS